MTEATCPKCNGSGREPYNGNWAHITAGYRDGTVPCQNCGGQTMSMQATGQTRIDPATGLGCMHEFVGTEKRNCYVVYTCKRCGIQYDIDSGD